MNTTLHALLAAGAFALAAPAFGQITFYENEGFRGSVHTTRGALDSFAGWKFNDRASSVVVERGRWEVCEGTGFTGRCAILRPGSYDRLSTMGLNDRLSSARPATAASEQAYQAEPPMRRPNYEYRQRPSERLFEVRVTSVHAVLGPPERRCWIERDAERSGPDADRGVISHRRGGSALQRCVNVGDGKPDHWEVGYVFRGAVHNVQMSAAPGPTITVNRNGEPRM